MVSKSITKKKMNERLQENDDVEEQGYNETAKNINNPHETMLVIRRYEDIIKTQNKKVLGYIGKQEQLLKRFKDTKHFPNDVGQSRSTIYLTSFFTSF